MTTMATTKPQRGEHLISYAYPTSPLAKQLMRSSSGCYAVQTHGAASAFGSYGDALSYAATLKTAPQRWSMDHPFNAKYLEGIQAFEKIVERPGEVSPVYIVGAEIRSQSGDIVARCASHPAAVRILAVARDQSAYADWLAALTAEEKKLSRQVNAFLHRAHVTSEAINAPM